MHGYTEFERWYIAGFLTLFGIFMVLKGPAMSACSQFFFLELRDPKLKDRFRRVVDRRYELESDVSWAWRITGVSSIVFGALVYFRVLQPVIGYALLCAGLAIVTSQIYLSMRNRSERRAASLQPRTVTSSVPALWFAGAVVSALLPLLLVGNPDLRISSVIVTLACLVVVVVAVRTSNMAALLAGDDPDVEVYVDNRLRWSRVAGLLVLAFAASYVFIAMGTPALRISPPLLVVVQIASSVLFFGFMIWSVVMFFRGRMREPKGKENLRVT